MGVPGGTQCCCLEGLMPAGCPQSCAPPLVCPGCGVRPVSRYLHSMVCVLRPLRFAHLKSPYVTQEHVGSQSTKSVHIQTMRFTFTDENTCRLSWGLWLEGQSVRVNPPKQQKEFVEEEICVWSPP